MGFVLPVHSSWIVRLNLSTYALSLGLRTRLWRTGSLVVSLAFALAGAWFGIAGLPQANMTVSPTVQTLTPENTPSGAVTESVANAAERIDLPDEAATTIAIVTPAQSATQNPDFSVLIRDIVVRPGAATPLIPVSTLDGRPVNWMATIAAPDSYFSVQTTTAANNATAALMFSASSSIKPGDYIVTIRTTADDGQTAEHMLTLHVL